MAELHYARLRGGVNSGRALSIVAPTDLRSLDPYQGPVFRPRLSNHIEPPEDKDMFLRKLSDSCTLTEGMAARLGHDVAEAIEHDPEISASKFRAAVFRCMTCENQDDCKRLQASTDHLDHAPDYCRNAWG